MSRIKILDFENARYIADTYENNNVIYHETDVSLEHPLGTVNKEWDPPQLVGENADAEDYNALMEIHNKIRKIDPEGVKNTIETMQMANKLPKSPIIDVDKIVEFDWGDINPDTDEPDELDFTDLAEGTLTSDDEKKLENIIGEMAQTGEVTYNRVKKEHEILYPKEELLSELVSILQGDQIPASVSHSLASEYIEIAELNADRLKSSNDPFEKYKYTNPIIYKYLRHIKEKDKLPTYTKYWLIPIVLDKKKVYNSKLSESQIGSSLSTDIGSGLSLAEEIKKENDIFLGVHGKTDKDVNTNYTQSRNCYEVEVSDEHKIFGDTTGFENPDYDLQDYTIHVLRYNTIGQNNLELRKAYGSVYKVQNKYENQKKLTQPIIGLQYYLSVEGEIVNTVGFLRLPISVTTDTHNSTIKKFTTLNRSTIQNVFSDLYSKKKQIITYNSVEEIPTLTLENSNDIIAVIYPENADSIQLGKIFESTIPCLETIVKIYESKLNHLKNLEEFNSLLKYYDLDIKDLKNIPYSKLVLKMIERVKACVKESSTRIERLDKLFKDNKTTENVLSEGHSNPIIMDEFMKDNIIVNNYGKYPDFDTLKDSDLNRLIWITKQLDNGRLFYSVLNYLEINKYYLKLLNAEKSTNISGLTIKDFDKCSVSLQKEILSLEKQIGTAEKKLHEQKSEFSREIVEAHGLSKKLKQQHKPIVYVKNAEETKDGLVEVNNNLSNIFILEDENYIPMKLYFQTQTIKALKLKLGSLELHRERIRTIKDVSAKAQNAIQQNVARLKLLQITSKKNASRAQIKTDIKTDDLISPDQTVFDLLKHIKNANAAKGKEMYLKLIDNYGALSPDQNWIISKTTRETICCVHRRDQLLEKSLDMYLDINSQSCKICHEQIGEIDFDTFGGYDEDQNQIVTHEGNVIDSHNEDLKREKEGLQSPFELATDVDCGQFKDDEFKKYACVVLKYVRNRGQIKMNNDQLIDAINMFYGATKINDLDTNINLDDSNKFFLQKAVDKYEEQFIKTQKGNRQRKGASDKTLFERAAKLSIRISLHLDRYILAMVSAIITLELSEPEKYPSSHGSKEKLINVVVEQQKLNKTFIENIKSIEMDNKKLTPDDIVTALSKNPKLPYIGSFENVTPTEYVGGKFQEYYKILRDYPDIKEQYSDVEEIVKSLDTEEPSNVVGHEDLLDEVPSVDNFEYNNVEEYDKLLSNIDKRLKYLDKYRLIQMQKLSNIASNLIKRNTDIMKDLSSYSVNQECPTDIRQFYIDYLIGIKRNTIEEHNIMPQYMETKALDIKTYNMSGQKEEFELLENLLEDPTLKGLRGEIVDIDSEIGKISEKSRTLQKQDKFPKIVNPLSKTTSTQFCAEYNLHDPEKAKKWKTLTVAEEFVINPITDKRITELVTQNSKNISTKTKYLVDMLCAHLNTKGFKSSKYQSILDNLGSPKNKIGEIKKDTESLKNKYNHEWSTETVAYIFKKEVFDQENLIRRDLIKSYIYLVHYLVSVLRNEFTVASVPDVNEEVSDMLDFFKSEVRGLNIFKKYKYLLDNQEIANLVGVSDKSSSLALGEQNYKSPVHIANLLHYTFVFELVNNLGVLYDLSADTIPTKTTQEGVVYCQFVTKLLDLIGNLNDINDTTSAEINNMFMANMSKKAASYQSMKGKLHTDELAIWRQQINSGLKTNDQLIDPSSEDMYKKCSNGENVKKVVDSPETEQAVKLPSNEFEGEQENDNFEEFGDDIGYADE